MKELLVLVCIGIVLVLRDWIRKKIVPFVSLYPQEPEFVRDNDLIANFLIFPNPYGARFVL